MTTIMLDEQEQPVDVGDAADLILKLRAENQRLSNKLNTDSQNFEIQCLKAENKLLRARGDGILDRYETLRTALLSMVDYTYPDTVNGASIIKIAREALEATEGTTHAR